MRKILSVTVFIPLVITTGPLTIAVDKTFFEFILEVYYGDLLG